jgi:hypothetical protein
MFTVPSDIALAHWTRDALYSEIKKSVQEEFVRDLQILHEKDGATLYFNGSSSSC